jgi:serine/threonine protein kinase
MATAPHLANLSDADRRTLEGRLEDFERSWDENRFVNAVRDLPVTDPLRLPALIEMARIDLKCRWRRGSRVRVEAYLKACPDLGNADTVPLALLQTEYEARRQAGDQVSAGQFASRFPRRSEELRQWEQESATRQAPTPAETAAPATGTMPSQPSTGPVTGRVGRPSDQFGRYRLIKKLGQGGMGTVYLAKDTQLDRQVALKVPHFTEEDGPELLQRFHREARSAATVVHTNICPVYDVGQIDGVHYLAMAYVEGQTLAEVVRGNKQLPQPRAVQLVRKLASAMEEAHGHGIIHRDLKPGNVMINARGEPVIMDFGLARRLNSDDPRLTRAGAVLGSPSYMAPEQLSGDANAIGPWCDVYSLGVILYELLTGRVPFEGPPATVWAQLLMDEPAPPSKHRPDLDPGLEAVVLKAMTKKKESRFASMAEFAEALEPFQRGAATEGPSGEVRTTTVTTAPGAQTARPHHGATPKPRPPRAEGGGPPPAPPAREITPKPRPPRANKETDEQPPDAVPKPPRQPRPFPPLPTRWVWWALGGLAVLILIASLVYYFITR